VVYGRPGCGKAITLAHIMHFGHADGWLVLPLMNMKQWIVNYYEVAPSTHTPGAIDHIANANIFLKNFKHANPGRLEGCVTHREYVWSQRERTAAGAPLAEVGPPQNPQNTLNTLFTLNTYKYTPNPPLLPGY
jgi:small subunit ribosomal protein S29